MGQVLLGLPKQRLVVFFTEPSARPPNMTDFFSDPEVAPRKQKETDSEVVQTDSIERENEESVLSPEEIEQKRITRYEDNLRNWYEFRIAEIERENEELNQAAEQITEDNVAEADVLKGRVEAGRIEIGILRSVDVVKNREFMDHYWEKVQDLLQVANKHAAHDFSSERAETDAGKNMSNKKKKKSKDT